MSSRLPVVDNTFGLPSTSPSPRGPVTDGGAVGGKELVIAQGMMRPTVTGRADGEDGAREGGLSE